MVLTDIMLSKCYHACVIYALAATVFRNSIIARKKLVNDKNNEGVVACGCFLLFLLELTMIVCYSICKLDLLAIVA